jgi:guanylate kinase
MEKLIVVIEGPSGVGKDSVIQGLVEKHPGTYAKLASVATRKMREGETNGNPYWFVTKRQFNRSVGNGRIFEHTLHPDGTYRGMSRTLIKQILDKGLIPLKDVDMVGINALKQKFPNRVLTIFLTAPKEVVAERLLKRGGCEQDIALRLANYDEKMKLAPLFDFILVNQTLQKAVDELHDFVINYLKGQRQ